MSTRRFALALVEVDLESIGRRESRWQRQGPRFREESARYAEPIPNHELVVTKLEQAGRPLA